MGLIKDMIVNAVGEAAREATRDIAIGAAATVVTAAAAVTSATVKGAKAVSKGVSAVAGFVEEEAGKAGEFIDKVRDPLIAKKVNKMTASCSELFLINVVKSKHGARISFYTSDTELCMEVRNNRVYHELVGFDGEIMATFSKERRLHTHFVRIHTNGGDEYTYSLNKGSDNKIHYQMGNSFDAVKKGVFADVELYSGNEKIALIKTKPVKGVDYALLVFNDIYDFEIVLMTICNFII